MSEGKHFSGDIFPTLELKLSSISVFREGVDVTVGEKAVEVAF